MRVFNYPGRVALSLLSTAGVRHPVTPGSAPHPTLALELTNRMKAPRWGDVLFGLTTNMANKPKNDEELVSTLKKETEVTLAGRKASRSTSQTRSSSSHEESCFWCGAGDHKVRHCSVKKADLASKPQVFRVDGVVITKSEFVRQAKAGGRAGSSQKAISQSQSESEEKGRADKDALKEKMKKEQEDAEAALRLVRVWKVNGYLEKFRGVAVDMGCTLEELLALFGIGGYTSVARIQTVRDDPDAVDDTTIFSVLDELERTFSLYKHRGPIKTYVFEELVPVEIKYNPQMWKSIILAAFSWTIPLLILFFLFSLAVPFFADVVVRLFYLYIDLMFGAHYDIEGDREQTDRVLVWLCFGFVVYKTIAFFWKAWGNYILLFLRPQHVRVTHHFHLSIDAINGDQDAKKMRQEVMQYMRTDKRNISFRAAKGLDRALPAWVKHETSYKLQGDLKKYWTARGLIARAAEAANMPMIAPSLKLRGGTRLALKRITDALKGTFSATIRNSVFHPWHRVQADGRGVERMQGPEDARLVFQVTVPSINSDLVDLTYISWMATHPRFMNFHYSFSDADRFLRESFNTNGSIMGNYDHPLAIGIFQSSRVMALVMWLIRKRSMSGFKTVCQDWGF